MLFMHTDFPEPVVPATNKWGMSAKSLTTGEPEILFPKAIGKLNSFFLNFSSETISLKKTFSLLEFGISIPTVFFPGSVAILVETELVYKVSCGNLGIFPSW